MDPREAPIATAYVAQHSTANLPFGGCVALWPKEVAAGLLDHIYCVLVYRRPVHP
jgi:hypothetical protein